MKFAMIFGGSRCRHQHSCRIVLLLTSISMLAACASAHPDSHRDHEDLNRMIFSPNGEPLNGGSLGRPTCAQAMTRWFGWLDAKHAGSIDQSQYLADARLQFHRMDIDGNGYLVPEELERFRQPYRQIPAVETASAAPENDQGSQSSYQQHRHRHGGGAGGSGNSSGGSSANNGGGAVVDPVMSADTSMDNRVTPDEFMVYAQKTFATLDSNHDGVLTLPEVLAVCRPEKTGSGSNENEERHGPVLTN